MKLLKIYESDLSKRKTELYLDNITGIFILEFYDNDGNFVASELIEKRSMEHIESIAINWIVSPELCDSIISSYKVNNILAAICDITGNLIHKQHNINEKLINITYEIDL
jgi:hypothetical protein